MDAKIGIVILNYESASALRLTLKSLELIQDNTDFVVGVVDNASVDGPIAKTYYEDFARAVPNRAYKFISNEENKGFAGGNNVMIRDMLGDNEITHIMLLNSDVVLPNFTLERLLSHNKDAIGPVTNKAGNLQTIDVPIKPRFNLSCIQDVNRYSELRYSVYENLLQKSEMLVAFCVLFSRELVEDVGLLDEQFFPGGYEDDDYCLRILDKHYSMYIARGAYVHHWGSHSFSTLPIEARLTSSRLNKERFENKWSTSWKDRTHDPLGSLGYDVEHILRKKNVDLLSYFSIVEGFNTAVNLIKSHTEAIYYYQHLQSVNLISSEQSTPELGSISKGLLFRQLLFKTWRKVKELISGKRLSIDEKIADDKDRGFPVLDLNQIVVMLLSKIPLKAKEFFDKTAHRKALALSRKAVISQENRDLREIETLLAKIKKNRQEGTPVVIFFAPYPTSLQLRDGYFKRVVSIHKLIEKNAFCIFVSENGSGKSKYPDVRLDKDRNEVVYSQGNSEHLKLIAEICNAGDFIYSHSILRLYPPLLSKITTSKILDFHGVVPEEAQLYGDSCGYHIYSNLESIAIEDFDHFIFVTEALENHIRQKYPSFRGTTIIIPTLDDYSLETGTTDNKNFTGNEIFIYSGGTQKWQLVDELFDAICSQPAYVYRLLSPDVSMLTEMVEEKCRMPRLEIKSVSPSEILSEYQTADYGFVLRDDIVVNNVACPTKLVEYLANGIVPILKTPNIGDFFKLGMRYLDVEDFKSGKLIPATERQAIIKSNKQVLDLIKLNYQQGKKDLIELLSKNTRAQKQQFQCETSNPKTVAIGLVVTSFDKGGLEQAVFNLYEGYKENGYNCYIFCESNQIGHFASKLKNPSDLILFHGNEELFIDYCKRRNVRWLHYQYNTFMLDRVGELGIRTIYSIQNIYTWLEDQEIIARSKMINSADYVVAGSTFTKEYYCQRTNTPEEDVLVIPIGVNTMDLDQTHLEPEFTREGLGITNGEITLGFIASFHEVKHQMNMLGVMEYIVETHPEVKLLLVANVGHPQYYELFQEECESSPAKGNVLTLPFIDHSQLGEFLRKTVDISILPTIQEGCSNTIIDSLYCGVPILMTDVGNSRDIQNYASVEVVSRPYEDILKFRQRDISAISRRKYNSNTKEIGDRLIYMVNNLEYYKKEAVATAISLSSSLDKSNMVDKYLKLIES